MVTDEEGYTWRVIPMGPFAYIPGGMCGMQVLKLAQPNLQATVTAWGSMDPLDPKGASIKGAPFTKA